MSVNESLAQISNGLVYSSMVVYAGSLVLFASSFASSRPLDEADADASGANAKTKAATPAGASSAAAVAKTGKAQAKTSASKSSASAATPAASAATSASSSASDHGTGDDRELAPGRKAGNIAMSLMWLATLLLAVGVMARGFSAGRVPWGNMYEFSISSALAVAVVFLIISWKRDIRWLGMFVVGAVLLTLGAAVTILYTDSAQLVPALKSFWLVIHVLAAIICGGAFTVGAGYTVAYLIRERAEKKALAAGTTVAGWFSSRVPQADRLDSMAYRINAFVFPLWTFAVIAGAIWAENAWGRYWGWDPKETWAFITWVIYAGYLHARATAGWRGRKAAVIGLLGFTAFLINYFGVNFFASGLHSYAGVS
jgi:cytochrome c-type biogenesis protein CcsB